jgi:hypothetical protein
MTTPADVLHAAAAWIGVHETPGGSNNVPGVTDWYGVRGSWCAMFVSRVFYDAGLPLPASTRKGFAWCSAGADWFRNQGRTFAPQLARPGDVAFFEWGRTAGGYDHVGIVVENTGTGLVTIEGNVSDRVGVHRRNYGEVPEVARPAYTDTPTAPPVTNPPTEDAEMALIVNDPDNPDTWWEIIGLERRRISTAFGPAELAAVGYGSKVFGPDTDPDGRRVWLNARFVRES